MSRIEPIIVVGTGCSGTSIVAEILHEHLGVFMGQDFTPSTEGRYECVVFQQMNRQMIAHRCTAEQWVAAITRVIRRRHREHARWGFKSIPTADLLEAYVQMIPHADVVHCKRDIEATLRSMGRRFRMSRRQAESFCRSKLDAIARANVTTIDVQLEELCASPEATIRDLCARLRLTYSQSATDAIVPMKQHTLAMIDADKE